MIEAEWLTATEPGRILTLLQGEPSRKFWSFTAAACGLASSFFPPELARATSTISGLLATAGAGPEERRAVREITGRWKERLIAAQDFEGAAYVRDFEHYLDSPAGRAREAALWSNRIASHAWLVPGSPGSEPAPLRRPARLAVVCEYRRRLADLLHCIFRNPFRPAAVDLAWLEWNGGMVQRLAEAVYLERELPSGNLSTDRLALVADALEDAGCVDAEILGHLRSVGPHVRGCWVMDLVLAKS